MALVDCRGLNCPEPVIKTKKALEVSSEVTTVVDNQVARDNVVKFATNQGLKVLVEEADGDYHISIGQGEVIKPSIGLPVLTKDYVLLVTNSTFGQESPELGALLMKSYLYTLVEGDQKPSAILLANGGAKLSCEDSPILEHLQTLESAGTEILTCGTCLDYFQLKESLQVGTITNMYTISEKMNKASKVINL